MDRRKTWRMVAASVTFGLWLSVAAGAAGETINEGTQRLLPTLVETYRIGDNAYVRALAVDAKRGSLWVGTSVGAMEIDLNTRNLKTVYTRKEGLANEYVFALGIDAEGGVWMGTNAGGVSRFKDGKFTTFFPMHGLADFWVYAFAFGKDGNPWIGTWDGASHYDMASGKFTTYRQELVNVWVYGIDIDGSGRIWFGTEGGVSMFDGKTWKAWTHDDGLGAANLRNLPRSSNTGLGTRARHDLTVAAPGAAETYNPNYVFAVHVDRRDRRKVWFGTWGGGVSLFDGDKTWRSFTEQDGLAGNIVYSIAEEADGTLWFGTNKGAVRYDGRRWSVYGRAQGLVSDNVYAIAVDPSGMVWLGTKGGVARLAYGEGKEKGK
jgi:ligand-binding sensor domain-containing protein